MFRQPGYRPKRRDAVRRGNARHSPIYCASHRAQGKRPSFHGVIRGGRISQIPVLCTSDEIYTPF